MSYCQACGAANQDGARFCEKCGAALSTGTPPAPPVTAQSAQVSVPPPPATPVAPPAAFAVAPPKAKGPSVVMLVVVGVAVLALLGAGIAGWKMFGPMSEDDYEDAAQDSAGDLYKAQSDIDSAMYVMYYTMDALENDSGVPWPEDELDSSEVDDARDAFDDGVETIDAAALELEELRPPRAYKAEDEALVTWANFMVDEWLPQYEELLVKAEDGMTYGEFSEDYDALMESLEDDGGDVWNEYWDAAEELNID